MTDTKWEREVKARRRQQPAEDKPTCICGAKISKHNPGLLCATCDKIHRQATLLDSKADKERIAARHVAGIYTRPEAFETPEQYLATLTKALDNLVSEIGLNPFDPENAEWWPAEEGAC
jgi:hypothetical protein